MDRTISISSAGKTFTITGWKIGYASASVKLTEAIQKVHQWTTFAVNNPAQHAVAFAMSQMEEYLPGFRSDYLEKRDLIYSLLKETQFNPHLPKGSYFIMVDIPSHSGQKDVDCAFDLVKNFGVATIPPSVFYEKSDEGRTMLRLCFAKKNETIVEAINNLKKYKSDN